jgi:hypothetical protein
MEAGPGSAGRRPPAGVGGGMAENIIYLQRETEEKARQPETKLSANMAENTWVLTFCFATTAQLVVAFSYSFRGPPSWSDRPLHEDGRNARSADAGQNVVLRLEGPNPQQHNPIPLRQGLKLQVSASGGVN